MGRSKRRERGQALVEFAMIAPLLVILIFGFTDVARMYNAWVTIQGAAREGARYGVTGNATCDGFSSDRLACIKYEAEQRTKPLTNNEANVSVSVKSWDYPNYTASLSNDPGQPCDALEVQIDYTFVPSTPLVGSLFGNLHLKGRERLVNEPFGTCS
jgi:Flp pilus assembly protein TadG